MNNNTLMWIVILGMVGVVIYIIYKKNYTTEYYGGEPDRPETQSFRGRFI